VGALVSTCHWQGDTKRAIKNNEKLAKYEKKAKIELSLGGTMRFYGFKLPDFFKEYGPISARSIEAAKAIVREKLGLKRLPQGFSIWELSERPLDRWRISA